MYKKQKIFVLPSMVLDYVTVPLPRWLEKYYFTATSER